MSEIDPFYHNRRIRELMTEDDKARADKEWEELLPFLLGEDKSE